MKATSMVFLVVLAAAIYLAVEVGGVFFRKVKLEDAIQQQISFAGQVSDDAIRQQILNDVRAIGLPPGAQRIGLVRTGNPRVLRVTITYEETVNLLVTKKQIPVRVQVNRRF
jgi:hypothetical protein